MAIVNWMRSYLSKTASDDAKFSGFAFTYGLEDMPLSA